MVKEPKARADTVSVAEPEPLATAAGYYDALIAAWNSPTQPPNGVTGTGLTPAMTTQQKCDAVNGWTVVGAIPTSMLVTADQVFNCIDWAEFAALTADKQTNVLAMCAVPGLLLGGSGNVSHMLPGMLVAYFPLQGKTIASLTALAKGTVRVWWGVPVAENGGGLNSHVTVGDAQAAGLG